MTAYLILVNFFSVSLYAQVTSLKLQSFVSNEAPFWFKSNNFARIDNSKIGTLLQVESNLKKKFGNDFSLDFGAELDARLSENTSLLLPFFFSKISFKEINLTVGRFYNSREQMGEEFSTGSLVISSNAIPIPKIMLDVDYVSFPFTQNVFQIKGSFAHGWFEENRTIISPYLHESSLYGKLNFKNVEIYAGLRRFAIWGGESRDPSIGSLPSSFRDLIKIVFSQEGGEGAPSLDQEYKLGNHFGNYDTGIKINQDNFVLEFYWQNLFEDKDGLVLKNARDGLFGLSFFKNQNSLFRGVVYEHIYSKDQSGPIGADGTRGGPGGRDNYYNHSFYRNGWTYFGNSAGTPFFTLRANKSYDEPYFENNRILVHHLGISGDYFESLSYKLLFSYSRNYGTYQDQEIELNRNGEYKFSPSVNQFSWMLGILYKKTDLRNIDFTLTLAGDLGELYTNSIGLLIGIEYKL